MRVVGGRHRGRKLAAPPGRAVRPTADRAREALFSMLASRGPDGASAVAGAHVLDGFCGTGALGIEALSRGAADAVFLDSAPAALAACEANLAALDEADRGRVLRADAARPPPPPVGAAPRDLVLLDPPYGSDLGAAALAALDAGGWLADDPLVVVECGAREPFAPPAGFAAVEERRFGAARLVFVRRAAGQPVS